MMTTWMKAGIVRTAIVCWLLAATLATVMLPADIVLGEEAGGTIPPIAPELDNTEFECDDGYYEVTGPDQKPNRIPQGWQQVLLDGRPRMSSARIQFGKSCEAEGVHIERISGRDSFTVLAWDIETPPEPGKPFDIALYQQTPVFPGGAYSVSGWFLTLCGGSAVPNDCPDNVYMAKMLGLDPTGGVDPEAESVIWIENRNNFVDDNDERIGWSNLYTTAVAEASTMTVFARIDSPFRWHGNHGFIDAISLVRSPVAGFVDLPREVNGNRVTVTWTGEQSPDVEAISGGNYRLYFDIEYRHEGDEVWRKMKTGAESPGSVNYAASCVGTDYHFRVRARAEQPEGEKGAWPNQRYPGPWSDVETVTFTSAPSPPPAENLPNKVYFPIIVRGGC